jgi:ketosteroid isomerase-like protein
MSEENVETVRRLFEAYNRWGVNPRGARDPELVALLHPEIEFHTYARAPEAGVYRGREAVIAYHERVFGEFKSIRVELEELLPAGDRVVIDTRQYTAPKDSEVEIMERVVQVLTIRDGMVAERKPFATRAEALEAAGLSD